MPTLPFIPEGTHPAGGFPLRASLMTPYSRIRLVGGAGKQNITSLSESVSNFGSLASVKTTAAFLDRKE